MRNLLTNARNEIIIKSNQTCQMSAQWWTWNLQWGWRPRCLRGSEGAGRVATHGLECPARAPSHSGRIAPSPLATGPSVMCVKFGCLTEMLIEQQIVYVLKIVHLIIIGCRERKNQMTRKQLRPILWGKRDHRLCGPLRSRDSRA